MSDNEILIRLAADLSDLKPEFQDLSDIWDKHNRDIANGEKAMRQYADNSVRDAKRINDALKEEQETIKQAEKIFESFRKSGDKAFDNRKLLDFTKKLKSEFDKIINLSKFSIQFDDKELKELSTLINSTDNVYKQLSITISAMQGKLDALDYKDEEAKKLSDELRNLKPNVEALAMYFDETAEKSTVSLNQIKSEIESVKDFIIQTEGELKNLDSQIEQSAPGKTQAGLIQDRNQLNKSLEEAQLNLESLNQEYKTLEAETNKATKAQVSLGTELRAVKEEMGRLELEGKENTDQYEKLKNKAVELQKSIKDVNEEIKFTASDTSGIQNVIGLVNGLVGIYATAEGAASLFGDENEELQQTLVKLNGVLAILNGLQATQAELANRQGLANKALTYIQTQYTIATDASTAATIRLGAALKLLGIGLLVGALAAVVVYWKDIAKWMGIVSEESERTAEINKRVNDSYGEQIAQLTILNKRVKEGGLSFREKESAVNEFNKTFGKTLGSVKTYNELEERMIKNGEAYVEYVKLKAQAEAVYQLAIENTKKAIEERERIVSGDQTTFEKFSKWYTENIYGFNVRTLKDKDFEAVLGLPNQAAVEDFLKEYSGYNRKILREYYENNQSSDSLLDRQTEINKKLEELAKLYNIVGDSADKNAKKATKSTKDWTAEIQKLLNELIKVQEQYAVGLIGNERDQQKAALQLQTDEEAKAYLQQINELKVSLERKKELIAEYNKLYNTETGLAYRKLREDLAEIDRQFEEQARQANIAAIMAINEVNNLAGENEIVSIKEKWSKIREELRLQIQLTEDETLKNDLNQRLVETVTAETKELNNAILEQNLERVDLEKEFADSIVGIYVNQSKELEQNEKLKNATLLEIQRTYLNNRLAALKQSLPEEQTLLFDDFVNQLLNSSGDLDAFGKIADQMKEAFGEDMAARIAKIVEELSDVNREAENLNKKGDLANWFKDTKSFAIELGEALGLQGEELTFFAETVGNAINQIWGAMQQVMAANLQDHQNKLSEIESLISQTESQVEEERQLYEDGYANNYDLRKKELEDLKKRKAQEKEELEKAQKIQASINNASILSNLAVQVSQLTTAATKVMNGTSGIPIVGVALGIGLVASMFAAMAAFKSQAQSFKSYRTGLEQGALDLKGASHERGGMGLYDSGTGKKVAEYEGGEQLFALNKGQQSKYGWLMQMMIDDAKGRAPIMSSLIGKIPTTGKKTIMKVRQVNEITRSAHQKRAEASDESRELLKEVKKFNKNFETELGGFKNRDENRTEYWETEKYFYVKKNGKTTKYKKNKEE